MSTEIKPNDLQLLLDEDTDVDEVVLGFKKNGTFHELVTIEPPLDVCIRQR
ncbi:hypothetical protein [Haloferax larsenii]|uniref:Uncharacterized protein n=1 Tax=Haloferax larsenii TaxID=302484 RepID=A0A1H7NEP8_HALLR|nr:hypothetical protein [Haloferax larsenii]SEL21791.1 hypothetical protein SAMN04488691_103283 [Haloferax larsenii]